MKFVITEDTDGDLSLWQEEQYPDDEIWLARFERETPEEAKKIFDEYVDSKEAFDEIADMTFVHFPAKMEELDLSRLGFTRLQADLFITKGGK